MHGSDHVSTIFAFLAGMLSFLSPCVLPLVPSYIVFITGLSFEEMEKADTKSIRAMALINSLFFISGFSLTFILLGASATFLGRFIQEHQEIMRKAGGILIIIFGLYIAGVLKIGALEKEKKYHMKNKPMGYLGSILVGITFAAGWTPCIGPILASILIIAGSTGKVMTGIYLLAVYSLGLAIPFILTTLAFSTFLAYFSAIKKYMNLITKLSGAMIILVGLIFLFDYVTVLSGYMGSWLPSVDTLLE